MKTFRNIVLTVLVVLAACHISYAQGGRGNRNGTATRVYFRVGSAVVDTSFRNNGRLLRAFVEGVNNAMRDTSAYVEAITIETGASPEGGAEFNEHLSMERAKSLRKYILDALPLNASQVKAWSTGADWEGLTQALRNSDCPWKDEILSVMAETEVRTSTEATVKERCIARLKRIDNGKAWDWMLKNIFPELRQGAGTLRCIITYPNAVVSVRDTLVIVHEYDGPDMDYEQLARDAADMVLNSMKRKPRRYPMDLFYKTPLFAVRSNLLIPLMNVGVEIPVGNRWSVATDVYAPWVWRPWMNKVTDSYSTCFQVLYGTAEARFWLGENHRNEYEYHRYRLVGHSVGLVLGGGYYDLEKDWNGMQGEFFMAGLDYMYALPLRKGNVRLEFNAGFGVMYTSWRGYAVHKEGGPLVGNWVDGDRFIPVPVKASVNLVVPITEKYSR